MSKTQQQQWWHKSMSDLAKQLSKGVLNEMKNRILSSNIKKEKLQLGSNSESMKSFFEREIKRYETRKQNMKKKQQESTGLLDMYRQMLRELVQANLSLAAKCRKNNIEIEKFSVCGKASSWR
jgi:predicted nucleotidyltransferase